MTAFYLACAGLVLFSGLFYLFPRVPKDDGEAALAQENREWLRLRRQELARDGAAELEEDAALRLLEETPEERPAPAGATRRFPAWVLLPVVAVASALLYAALGAAPDVHISRQLQSISPDTSEERMAALIGEIQARADARPDNLHYQALLGRYHMGRRDYAAALQAYGNLLESVPDDAQTLAYAAQAAYLAAGRRLDDQARLRAEQALAVDPHQRTALGLLGMASYEQGRYRAAIEYWERLLALEAPGSEGAAMIADVLSRAQAQLADDTGAGPGGAAAGAGRETAAAGAPAAGVPTSGTPAAGTPAAGTPAAGITISVRLPEGASVGPEDTVFVLARNATSGSRMPIAVTRLRGAELPATLRLDDGDSMAGQKLSTVAEVEVVAQVSPGGQPGEANATWLGRAGPVAPGGKEVSVDLLLARNAPR